MTADHNASSQNVDLVVVGGGAAGFTAADIAADAGLSVVLLEAADAVGGTTLRSSGGFWCPRNRHQRALGVEDDRDDVLRHMALFAYPRSFDPDADRLGLTADQHDALASFVDEINPIVEELEEKDILTTMLMGWMTGNGGMPPYYESPYYMAHGATVATKKLKVRDVAGGNPSSVAMSEHGNEEGHGGEMIAQFHDAAVRLGVDVRVGHRVRHLLTDDDGAVVGVEAEGPDGAVTVRSRVGVVVATGGFSHNRELAEQHLRGPIVGSCSVPTARGDFIAMCQEVGAALATMQEAWWSQLPVEPAMDDPSQPDLVSNIDGDSSIIVNGHGVRVVNEKLSYNERTKVHFLRDEQGGEPNRLLYFVYDDAVRDDDRNWPARWPVPVAGDERDYVIHGRDEQELAANIQARLERLGWAAQGVNLEADFAERLGETITRYSAFAAAGVDEDFGRGSTVPNREYSAPSRHDDQVNNTMYPFDREGSLHCIIMGASTLDTKGGPRVDLLSRVLREDGSPITGLYAAGNCSGSAWGEAYFGGGSTLGPAILQGYHAARDVVARSAESVKNGALAS